MLGHLKISPKAAAKDLWHMVTELLCFVNHTNVGSPFVHGSKKRRISYLLAVLILTAANAWTLRWIVLVFLEPKAYKLKHNCTLYAKLVLAFFAAITCGLNFLAAWVNLHTRLKPVFLQLHFNLPPPEHTEKSPQRYRPTLHGINEAMDKIKELVHAAEKNPEMRGEPVELLRSAYGQAFLYDIVHRVRRLRLRQGHLVRREKWKLLLFGSVLFLCCWIGIGGSRIASENCFASELLLEFFEIIGITFIALISISTFLGCNEFVRLLSESVNENHPLTDDEKFLISLLALNTEGSFNGLKRTQPYANIEIEGDVEAFLPISPLLKAYGPCEV